MEVQIHPYDPDVWDGPWIGAASFCDRLLIEEQGFYSIIRMVDSVTVPAATPVASGTGASVKLGLTLFLMFRSGVKPSSAELRVRRNAPNETAGTTPSQMVAFPGEGASVPVRIDFSLDFDLPGRYWFDVLLDDLIVTRVPLMIVFDRQSGGAERSEGELP